MLITIILRFKIMNDMRRSGMEGEKRLFTTKKSPFEYSLD